jgi:hypothetical protein
MTQLGAIYLCDKRGEWVWASSMGKPVGDASGAVDVDRQEAEGAGRGSAVAQRRPLKSGVSDRVAKSGPPGLPPAYVLVRAGMLPRRFSISWTAWGIVGRAA